MFIGNLLTELRFVHAIGKFCCDSHLESFCEYEVVNPLMHFLPNFSSDGLFWRSQAARFKLLLMLVRWSCVKIHRKMSTGQANENFGDLEGKWTPKWRLSTWFPCKRHLTGQTARFKTSSGKIDLLTWRRKKNLQDMSLKAYIYRM